MSVYTDLACEARELHPDIDGVTESRLSREGVEIRRVTIRSSEAAEKLGKRIGSYVTLDAPDLVFRESMLFETLERLAAGELRRLMNGLPEEICVLVVGLGNRRVTPDSFGPAVTERIPVTRHIIELMPDVLDKGTPSVCAVSPGVLGETGLESAEIVKSLVERFRPDAVIAADSLASRRAERISTTIQLSDAGIDPGSGVGNLRSGLNRDTLGVPVFAVGVPLVVKASTIISDALQRLAIDGCGRAVNPENIADPISEGGMDAMIMTPKDIDRIVDDMAGVAAGAVGRAIFGERYGEIKKLLS